MAEREPSTPRQIRSQPRGPHWVAWERGPHWVAWVADANGRPEGSVILVGETQQEAETRARKWAETAARG
jgi:hypothetical protein